MNDEPKYSYFKEWTCIFPGKAEISWKRGWGETGTKEEAEDYACKYANVIAVPLKLWEKYREFELRMVIAERKLYKLKEPNERIERCTTSCRDDDKAES